MGLAVGLVMGGLSGFGLYAMSPERVECVRGPAGIDCRLSRHVLGVPVRDTHLRDVRAVSLDETVSAPRVFPGSNRRAEGGTTYAVRFDTATGAVYGAAGAARGEQQAIVDGLGAVLEGQGPDAYEGSLGGGPLGWRLALGILFAVGALCLINIPFAAAQARRDRRKAARD